MEASVLWLILGLVSLLVAVGNRSSEHPDLLMQSPSAPLRSALTLTLALPPRLDLCTFTDEM